MIGRTALHSNFKEHSSSDNDCFLLGDSMLPQYCHDESGTLSWCVRNTCHSESGTPVMVSQERSHGESGTFVTVSQEHCHGESGTLSW